jgi:glycosyltransferase involved in cell wall biosynthesis
MLVSLGLRPLGNLPRSSERDPPAHRRSYNRPMGSPRFDGRNVLMLVENLSVPFDRRVWQEAQALRDAGFRVVVVCPRGIERDRATFELVEEIEIHRFASPQGSGGAVGYVLEYGVALVRIHGILRRLRHARRFDVVHAANPPDLLLPVVWYLRRRARLIFDHHDLAPELFLTRFGRRGIVFRTLMALERLSFKLAHVVISTNESYRQLALDRGRKAPADVFVVRNAPRTEVFCPPDSNEQRRSNPQLIAYVGMMGPQDGIENALHALAALRASRDDWRAVFAGDGDARPEMERLSRELGLAGVVEFVGLMSQDEVVGLISSAAVCLAPEPSNPLNDRSTMMKVAEYLAMACPVVAFDLLETRRTAGEAALYAPSGDIEAFASCISRLLDDEELCARLGAAGRERIRSSLSWEHSRRALLAAYERALEGCYSSQ